MDFRCKILSNKLVLCYAGERINEGMNDAYSWKPFPFGEEYILQLPTHKGKGTENMHTSPEIRNVIKIMKILSVFPALI